MPLKSGITDANSCLTNGLFDIHSSFTGADAHTPISGTSFKIVSHAYEGNAVMHIGFSFSKKVFIRVGSKDPGALSWEWTDWKQIL